ncbi:thioredoxin family protein [Aurantiacibacter hainanensis]|uniref:thioredoxin family protein n=1 Tax=Aurantiacibacter hainanensis TaxID=3076114 RepID=UPI0030C6BE69
MKPLAALAALAAAFSLAACATSGEPRAEGAAAIVHPEGAIFDPSLDAHEAVDTALARAAGSDRLVLLVMGANWCHDSRALTSYLMEPEHAALLEEHYETVYIDVGLPQTGDGFNLDVAERFGVTPEGTPSVLALTPTGELVNTPEDAISWRNSASRSPAAVLATLEDWVAQGSR